MAILDIKTENKDISWVIKKNPNTQKETNVPFIRPIKKGTAYSWYVNDNLFRIYFKENGKESSFYKDLNNNYLNQGQYNCAYAYSSMINEVLASALKETEKDIICHNEVTLQDINVASKSILNFFEKYFSEIGVLIKSEVLYEKVYSIKFSGEKKLYYMLNLVNVFCLIQSVEDKNIYIDMSENLAKKYASALKLIEAPYFIKYLFNSRVIDDLKVFQSIKELLENKNEQYFFGNTQKQRYDQIKRHIQPGKILQDIGCGELFYSKMFADKYNKVIAWDSDKDLQERNQKYIERKNFSNIELRGEYDINNLVIDDEETDLLITEMLEHIPKENAKKVLNDLKDKKFRKLILTLPNKDFNQFYKLESEFRHPDHYWEPNYEETESFIYEIFEEEKFEILFKRIGDKINNCSVSTLIVIQVKVD
jgi:predicted RNA methylase